MSMMDLLAVVNSDMGSTLNHLIWLNDYKTYGSNSYIAVDTDKYNELMRDYSLTMNDPILFSEALDIAIANNEFGKALSKYKKLSDPSVFNGVNTFDELVANNDALTVLFNDAVFTKAVMSNNNFLESLYSNPTNINTIQNSNAFSDLISAKSELISSDITIDDKVYIIDTYRQMSDSIWSETGPKFAYGSVSYKNINGETVSVSSNYNTFVDLNVFATGITLTTGTYSNVKATAKSNIVRLPLAKE